MDMDEFKEYILKKRRDQYDKRIPTQDDQRKCPNVATNQQNESLHGNHKSGTSDEV